MLAKNTKIKTSGLKLILKKLDYNVAVSVKRTDRGYKTSLLATDNCGSMFCLKLTLEERPLFINVVYNKYNQIYKIDYDYITQLSVDFISMKNHLNNNNEFRSILLAVI